MRLIEEEEKERLKRNELKRWSSTVRRMWAWSCLMWLIVLQTECPSRTEFAAETAVEGIGGGMGIDKTKS